MTDLGQAQVAEGEGTHQATCEEVKPRTASESRPVETTRELLPSAATHASTRMDRCRHCKERFPRGTLKSHQALNCAKRPAPREPRPCGCGCGAMVEQPPRGQPRNFLDFKHYKSWRAEQKRGKPSEARTSGPLLSEEEREALHMAPRRLREAAVALEASRMGAAMLTGEASHALWFRCLGVEVHAAP